MKSPGENRLPASDAPPSNRHPASHTGVDLITPVVKHHDNEGLTMGGLLDKANAAKEPETDDKPLEVEPAPVVQQKDSAAPQKASAASPVSGSPDNATKLNLAGWVIILLGAILSLQGGSWGFAVVAVVLVLGIGAIVQADRMRGSVSKPKLYRNPCRRPLGRLRAVHFGHGFPVERKHCCDGHFR